MDAIANEPTTKAPPVRVWQLSAVLAVLLWAASPAQAGEGTWLRLFHIGHDESPNVVQYDLVVDSRCRPLGSSPVKVYWKLRNKDRTRSLSRLERRAYAVEGLVKEQDGVRFHLAGRPQQTAHARVYEQNGECKAELWTSVKGEPAILDKAWIQTDKRAWFRLPKVLFVDLFARSARGDRIIERVVP